MFSADRAENLRDSTGTGERDQTGAGSGIGGHIHPNMSKRFKETLGKMNCVQVI